MHSFNRSNSTMIVPGGSLAAQGLPSHLDFEQVTCGNGQMKQGVRKRKHPQAGFLKQACGFIARDHLLFVTLTYPRCRPRKMKKFAL